MPTLADLIACSAAQLGGNGRLLRVDGRAVAILGEPDTVTAMVTHTGGGGSSLAETIALLIAARPTGLLVLADPDGRHPISMMLRDGIAIALLAPGELGSFGEWALELYGRRPLTASREVEPPRVDPCRTFVLEHALVAIGRGDRPGASLLWLTGAVQWLGDELPSAAGCDAGFLLLELARRSDELPRIETAIGALDRLVVPLSRPGARPAKPTERRVAKASEDDWDFFDDPDPAAESEWTDARHVFEHCDGMSSIEVLTERTMIGRFRTLQALLALLDRSHVTLTELHAAPDPSDELADLIADLELVRTDDVPGDDADDAAPQRAVLGRIAVA